MSNKDLLANLVRRCTTDLFAAYDIPTTVAEPPQQLPEFAYGAVLGFTGESMRGTLVLAMAAETIHRSSPPPSGSLREWIAELSNQLLGRIKNQLLAYGVEIHVTVPVVIRGRLLSSESGPELVPYRFIADGADVLVWFDPEIVAGLELVKVPDGEAHPEGATFFFENSRL